MRRCPSLTIQNLTHQKFSWLIDLFRNSRSPFLYRHTYTHTHMYIHNILFNGNGAKWDRLPFCRRLGVLHSQLWPFGEVKNLTPPRNRTVLFTYTCNICYSLRKHIRFHTWRGPNKYVDRIITCCYKISFTYPAFLRPKNLLRYTLWFLLYLDR